MLDLRVVLRVVAGITVSLQSHISELDKQTFSKNINVAKIYHQYILTNERCKESRASQSKSLGWKKKYLIGEGIFFPCPSTPL